MSRRKGGRGIRITTTRWRSLSLNNNNGNNKKKTISKTAAATPNKYIDERRKKSIMKLGVRDFSIDHGFLQVAFTT